MDKHATEAQRQRVERAKLSVLMSAPFYSPLVMRMRAVMDTKVRTVQIDGARLVVNPAFSAQLTDALLGEAVLHELAHYAQARAARGTEALAELAAHAQRYDDIFGNS